MQFCTLSLVGMAPSYSNPILLPHLLIVVIIISVATPASAQSTAGFLSIDIGSAETTNYTDTATGILWTPDLGLWPDIADWSTTYTSLAPPPSSSSSDVSQAKHYQSFRYFKPPGEPARSPSPAKFCYSLPAQANKYYLIRVSFWCSSNLASALTRVPGVLSFYILIDTYVGPQINISLPQTFAVVEEFYVQALDRSMSVNLCFSTESGVSDAPFVNTIELRPLTGTLNAIKVLDSSMSALRALVRYNLGAADNSPPILR